MVLLKKVYRCFAKANTIFLTCNSL
jgi:hypothetical protein